MTEPHHAHRIIAPTRPAKPATIAPAAFVGMAAAPVAAADEVALAAAADRLEDKLDAVA
jgi:hypothetical protein